MKFKTKYCLHANQANPSTLVKSHSVHNIRTFESQKLSFRDERFYCAMDVRAKIFIIQYSRCKTHNQKILIIIFILYIKLIN